MAFFPDDFPIPGVNDFSKAFFTSGTVAVQQCAACGTVQHPPEEVCNNCLKRDFNYPATNGQGTIYSYIVVHNPPSPAYKDVVPYATVLVSLDEHPQVRILGNVLNRKPGEIAIGQRVKAVFEEVVEDGETLRMPQWEVV